MGATAIRTRRAGRGTELRWAWSRARHHIGRLRLASTRVPGRLGGHVAADVGAKEICVATPGGADRSLVRAGVERARPGQRVGHAVAGQDRVECAAHRLATLTWAGQGDGDRRAADPPAVVDHLHRHSRERGARQIGDHGGPQIERRIRRAGHIDEHRHHVAHDLRDRATAPSLLQDDAANVVAGEAPDGTRTVKSTRRDPSAGSSMPPVDAAIQRPRRRSGRLGRCRRCRWCRRSAPARDRQ